MKIKQLTALLLFSYLAPWLYAILSQFWVVHGGASTTLNRFEFPIIAAFCITIYFNPCRNRVISRYTFAPPLTVLGVYVLYDTAYSYFARSPRVSDWSNIASLYSVSPWLFTMFILAIIVVAMPTLLSFFAWGTHSASPKKLMTVTLKFSALVALSLAVSSGYSYSYQKTNLHFNDWSNVGNVKKNGRVSSFLYYYNKRENILANFNEHKHFSISRYFYKTTPADKRNIHIVILESFADPRKIKNFSYQPSPVHDNLLPFLPKGHDFSIIQAPVYGGGTAQTEFEILTGIPALARIDSIDFNLFEGQKTSSLVQKLKEVGYHTVASIATEPVFYNSTLAYKGIGFDDIFFLGDNPYFEEGDDPYLFDGDFLDANLAYIKRHLLNGGGKKPFLNYIVGMYGHMPFERNKELRPDVISVTPENDQVFDMTNQFYYRTKVLGKFLHDLQTLDPDAIVLVTSDHLPPIFDTRKVVYESNLQANCALLLNSFEAIDVSGATAFETTHILWNLLANSSKLMDNETLFGGLTKEDFYYSYIMEAMGIKNYTE